MTDPRGVDDYLVAATAPADPVIEAALAANATAGLPPIDVSIAQGRLLALFVQMTGARRVLEVGTLGGVSTIFMGRALGTGGRIVTLERDSHHAAVARANLAAAGLADRAEVREGPAGETLDAMIAAGEAPFDLVFIDADKPSNPRYAAAALALSRPGTIVIVDNVVREGRVAVEDRADAAVTGTRALFDMVKADGRLTATVIQTVGAKGWDGFLIARVDG